MEYRVTYINVTKFNHKPEQEPPVPEGDLWVLHSTAIGECGLFFIWKRDNGH